MAQNLSSPIDLRGSLILACQTCFLFCTQRRLSGKTLEWYLEKDSEAAFAFQGKECCDGLGMSVPFKAEKHGGPKAEQLTLRVKSKAELQQFLSPAQAFPTIPHCIVNGISKLS